VRKHIAVPLAKAACQNDHHQSNLLGPWQKKARVGLLDADIYAIAKLMMVLRKALPSGSARQFFTPQWRWLFKSAVEAFLTQDTQCWTWPMVKWRLMQFCATDWG